MDEFNEAMFKTKVDNIFVKLYTSIMKGNLGDVKHFLSTSVYEKFNNYVNQLSSSGKRNMYDELNVKDTKIIKRTITSEKEIVEVELISRYMDYIIDINTGNVLSGDDTRRVEKRNILTFEKKLDTKDSTIVRKCPGCGASISVNTSGKCEYCGSIFNQSDYDYILTSIVTN